MHTFNKPSLQSSIFCSQIIPATWQAPKSIKTITIALSAALRQHFASSPSFAPRRAYRSWIEKNYLPGGKIQWLALTHGNQVVCASPLGLLPNADASFTRKPNLACAVTTGDCLPIALTDTYGSQVAMIHAGWRGLANGIIRNTIKAMQPTPPLIAWIGPHICANCYQVGHDLHTCFKSLDPKYASFFKKNDKGFLLELAGIAKQQLMALGIRNITTSPLCTYCNHTLYSYRRGKITKTGGNITLIWQDPNSG